jgi:hypothetical protein
MIMKTYNYKGFEFYKGKNSYFVGNKKDGQIAPNDNVAPQTITECKAVINSWLKVPEKRTVKLTYQILAKDTVATQKTFTRTVSNNYNAYNEFEEKAREFFKGYKVKFNHPGKVIILS